MCLHVCLSQEDLAAAEMELVNWYETMQRETDALKLAYKPADGAAPTSPDKPSPSALRCVHCGTQAGIRQAARNHEMEALKQQLQAEQRRAATAELALAKGQHLQRLLQAAVRTVLLARQAPQVCLKQSHARSCKSALCLSAAHCGPGFASGLRQVLIMEILGDRLDALRKSRG